MPALNKILIVDDVQTNVLLLKKILKDDYCLDFAYSGEEALEKLEDFRPDMILLDIMMPGMDGYEVCKRIRQEKKYSYIKVILVSAKASVQERLEGYEAGADDYITKPFVKQELEAKVRVFSRLKYEEELSQLKGDLLTLFSHETKTPLSGIIGLSEILMRNTTLDDNVKKRISMISERAYQLLNFIKKSSLLCSLKGGWKLELRNESIIDQIQNIIKKYKPVACDKNVSIRLSYKENIQMKADWTILNNVFEYSIDNAIKYSPENDEVLINIEKIENKCIIKITDKGKGIDPKYIEKIFTEFAIEDILHHQRGLGLSLAISKNVIELHEGGINVESTINEGTTFLISLPAKY